MPLIDLIAGARPNFPHNPNPELIMRWILILCVSVVFLSCASQAPLTVQSPLVLDSAAADEPEPEITVVIAAVAPSYTGSSALAMLDWLIFRYEIVHFDFDSSDLLPEARTILARKARWIKDQDPAMQLVVVGHCDQRGSDVYNIRLGARRAEAVKRFLVDAGVAPERVRIVSVGKRHPVVHEEGESAWSINRRAEVINP